MAEVGTEGQAGGQGGAGPAGAAGGAAAPPPAWHAGLDAETLGHIQNRGLTLDDPKAVVENVVKAHREAQGKLGVPPDQLIRLLRPDSTPADIKSFWGRLGAPDKPEGYDFKDIKFSDGTELDDTFKAAMRQAYDANHLPKESADRITSAFVKFMEEQDKAEAATKAVKLQGEREALAKEWARDPDGNLFIARRGAQALGLTPEQVTQLEDIVGYAGVMKAMHKVGMLNREDSLGLVSGAGPRGPMTQAQAVARLEDLKKDSAWVSRWAGGGSAEKQEWQNLTQIISGVFEAA